jgi:outer membrane phospholipase A
MDLSNWTRWEIEHPPAFEPYGFETIDIQWWYDFSEKYWSLPFFVTFMYYVGLYYCYQYMKDRPAMDLRGYLFLWNTAIGAFSIMALYRMTPEFIRVLSQHNGFHRSVCVR